MVVFRELKVKTLRSIAKQKGFVMSSAWLILGNPGATSRDDAIFLGESLLQVLKSPWELILTEPVPEMVKFRSADWAEKYFSVQSARSSSNSGFLTRSSFLHRST